MAIGPIGVPEVIAFVGYVALGYVAFKFIRWMRSDKQHTSR
jgi:hypothetical protein